MPHKAMLSSILRTLDRHRRYFDLDKRRFGERLMDTAVNQIQREMDQEIDPDGRPWEPLSPSYLAWKQKNYPGLPMAVLEGIMKTTEELSGRRHIGPTEAVMVYGISEEAIEHASNFQDPENPNQPNRRFYEFSKECLTRMDGVCNEHYRKFKP